MIRLGIVIAVLFVSFTFSSPVCNLLYWVNLNPDNCISAANGTYMGLNYIGNCTMSPETPTKSSYQLVIDFEAQTVNSFTIFNDRNCRENDEFLSIRAPLRLDECGLLLFKVSSTSLVPIGNIFFYCKDES